MLKRGTELVKHRGLQGLGCFLTVGKTDSLLNDKIAPPQQGRKEMERPPTFNSAL